MIDIKWLLYRYHSIKQARSRAKELLSKFDGSVSQAHDPNWWIHGKGGLPKSRTENAFFDSIDRTDKIQQLYEYASNLDIILTAIDSAIKTLKKELHDIIVYRYIDDLDVSNVAEKCGLLTDKKELNMRKYYRLHNIALEEMNIGCRPLEFIYTQEDIEIIIGKLGIVRKSVSSVSQNRVETALFA